MSALALGSLARGTQSQSPSALALTLLSLRHLEKRKKTWLHCYLFTFCCSPCRLRPLAAAAALAHRGPLAVAAALADRGLLLLLQPLPTSALLLLLQPSPTADLLLQLQPSLTVDLLLQLKPKLTSSKLTLSKPTSCLTVAQYLKDVQSLSELQLATSI